MIRFHAPDIENTLTLPESDSQHAVRVLRMQPGERLEVTDGLGHIYRCVLTGVHPKHAGVEIIERIDCPPVWSNIIAVAVAPTKHNDRMEWMVEKLVEIGVNRITPIRCDRSERKDINTDRLIKIAVSAMKQSLKATLPRIDTMTPLAAYLTTLQGCPQRYVGYCDNDTERRLMAREYHAGVDTAILIGPEGDFTPDEITTVRSHGFVPVTMGDNRLRTETAALVAVDTCQILNQLQTQ